MTPLTVISAPPGRDGISILAGILALAISLWAMAAEAAYGSIEASGRPVPLCRQAVRIAETGSNLPRHMLMGIARVESGRYDRLTGRVEPWPWTINAEGSGTMFETKAEAIAFARRLQERGMQSFDVGCMQINMQNHPNAFRDLDEAFDPIANAGYAVKFLTKLYQNTGSWEEASAWYHSATPTLGNPYREKVVTAMADEAKVSGTDAPFLLPTAAGGQEGGFPLRSMPAALGRIIRLARNSGGAAGSPALPPIGAASMPGRGLDAYRRQPVAIVSQRQMAER